MLNEDLKLLEEAGQVSFFKRNNEDFSDAYALIGPSTGKRKESDEWLGTAALENYMSGDLLWMHTALGKEGYQSWWCPYCQKFKTHWQDLGHTLGEHWTITSLKAQAARLNDTMPRLEKRGVKELPLFDAIEVNKYIVAVLHLTIWSMRCRQRRKRTWRNTIAWRMIGRKLE